ncbi:colanic acid biosynthesis glycosyltransferase WcaL [bacterium]|nr:MAG: colanic acid biosynthesis glycosyltransferase WcaL [bacterium]
MRIAYVTSQFPFGPGEAFLEAEAAALAELCEEVLVVPARPKSVENRYPGLRARSIRLPPYAPRTLVLAAGEALRSPVRAMSLLVRLIGLRYRLAAKLKNLVLYPKALAVASVLRSERVEHIHAHWLSTPSTIAYLASELTGIPWSCTAHRFDIFEENLLPAKLASARFVRAISARNRALVVARGNGSSPERCTVLHMGVSLRGVSPEPREQTCLRLVCAASLVPVKGHRYLIEALARLRDRGLSFHCDVIGDGPLHGAIARQITETRLGPFVRLRGSVPHESLLAELMAGVYDVAVLASTESGMDFEGIPVALMEAMAAGLPCVATCTGSIPELIDEDCGSLLVPQRDALALAAAINAFADPARRSAAGHLARRRIAHAFDVREITERLYRMMSAV